jgi:hypothetical protein
MITSTTEQKRPARRKNRGLKAIHTITENEELQKAAQCTVAEKFKQKFGASGGT